MLNSKPYPNFTIVQIESIHGYVKNDLLPMINSSQKKQLPLVQKPNNKNQLEDEELAQTLEKIIAQHTALLKEYENETERRKARLSRVLEENKRDKLLFSFVTKYIRKAFDMRAKLESKEVNVSPQFITTKKNSLCTNPLIRLNIAVRRVRFSRGITRRLFGLLLQLGLKG